MQTLIWSNAAMKVMSVKWFNDCLFTQRNAQPGEKPGPGEFLFRFTADGPNGPLMIGTGEPSTRGNIQVLLAN